MAAAPPLFLLLIMLNSSPSELLLGGGWGEQTIAPPDSQEIRIPIPWMIEGTLVVTSLGDTMTSGKDYHWDNSIRTLVVFPREDSDSLRIRYRTANVADSLTFRYYALAVGPDSGGAEAGGDSKRGRPVERINPLGGWGSVRRSGMLSRGVRFGDESGGATSGMRLELSGDPAPDVRIDALLDDRGMPLESEGASATLGELERVRVRVSTPSLAAELGDWDAHWRSGRYSDLDRRLKGGWLGARRGRLAGEFAAGGSDLTYRAMTLIIRSGDQGPYELTDRSDVPGVAVAVGSEHVRLNGALLARGRSADYTIDYARGEITFTPRIILRDDSRIEVEYQCLDSAYPRFFYGGQGLFNPPPDYLREAFLSRDYPSRGEGMPSSVSVQVSALSDGQDGKRPQTWAWRDEWRVVAAAAGDDPSRALVSSVDSVGVGNGDYAWMVSGADSILVFMPPDSLGRAMGYLTVRFERDASGGYVQRYDRQLRAVYYEWVGEGFGSWSPMQALPLPERLNHIDARLGCRLGSLAISSETAASDYDRNTLSARDDGDNTGLAWQGRLAWDPRPDSPVRWEVTGENRQADYFSPQRSVEPDYRYRWNLGSADPAGVKSLATTASIKPLPSLRLTGDGGWLKTDGAESRRTGADAAFDHHGLRLKAEFDQAVADHSSNKRDIRTVWAGETAYQRGIWEPFYNFRSEVNRTSGENLTGGKSITPEGGMNLHWSARQTARLAFNYRGDDRFLREGDRHWSDMRAVSTVWEGAGYLWGGWNATAQRNWTTYTSPEIPSRLSTSAHSEGRWSPPSRPWSFNWDYTLNTGGSRRRETTAVYVGEGEGGYRREGDRYVPDPDGSFDLQEVVMDSIDRRTDVDFSAQLQWRAPRKDSNRLSSSFAGVSSHRLRWTLTNANGGEDPWKVFLLLPESFRTKELTRGRILIEDETGFHEGSSRGDETLRLRREDRVERATGYGESTREESVVLRIRRNLGRDWNLRIEPQAERTRRWGADFSGLLSRVEALGGEAEIGWAGNDSWDGSLMLGYAERKDRLVSNRAWEYKFAPRCLWRMTRDASASVEGQWLRLATEMPTRAYDLLRGCDVGNNYQVTLNSEYRMHEHLTATGYYRGRWRGNRPPRHEASVELTATF